MQNALKYLLTELNGIYSESEIRILANRVFGKITGYTPPELLINKNTVFSEEQMLKVKSFATQLQKSMPLQYVLGEADFYNRSFFVNESVLIPRPETEELVEWISMDAQRNDPLRILDIGTGSGCIAVTLKLLFPNAQVDAFDVSDDALETAALNAKRNNAEVRFSKADILNPDITDQKWDIIVSNPPYICENEKGLMSDNVVLYEPSVALFVPDDDSLLFYRKIAQFAQQHLVVGGKLFFEINSSYGAATMELLDGMAFDDLELRKDISGNDRMIRARKLK